MEKEAEENARIEMESVSFRRRDVEEVECADSRSTLQSVMEMTLHYNLNQKNVIQQV